MTQLPPWLHGIYITITATTSPLYMHRRLFCLLVSCGYMSNPSIIIRAILSIAYYCIGFLLPQLSTHGITLSNVYIRWHMWIMHSIYPRSLLDCFLSLKWHPPSLACLGLTISPPPLNRLWLWAPISMPTTSALFPPRDFIASSTIPNLGATWDFWVSF